MPFPTTVRASRTLVAPLTADDRLLDMLAGELWRAGMQGVCDGRALVPLRGVTTSDSSGPHNQLITAVEIEVQHHGQNVELVAEADVSRLPLTFAAAMLVASAAAGGLHAISLAGGLLGGILIAVVPWWIARQQLSACLRRVAHASRS